VKPTDFFKTAELLKSQTSEAHLRTSVGRSYYATFLYFREYLADLGLRKRVKRHSDAHAFVVQCLQFSSVEPAREAATNLSNLKQLREDADYNLRQSISQRQAEDAIAIGKRAISNYKSQITSSEEKILIKTARKFAKNKDWI